MTRGQWPLECLTGLDNMDEIALKETLAWIGKSEQWKEFRSLMDSGARGLFFLMRCVKEAGANVNAGELAKRMGVSTARVARALKTLEAKGYIKRGYSSIDGRKVEIVLTEEGEKALSKREEHIKNALLPWINKISPEEQRLFLSILRKLF